MVQAFEAELKKYMAIETAIGLIAPVHCIGALSLETQPLKYSLKSEAGSWKAQFAKNLHRQGAEDLKVGHVLAEPLLRLSSSLECHLQRLAHSRLCWPRCST